MNTVADASGWNKLLNDPFFQQTVTKLDYEDTNRLLSIIGEDIRPKISEFKVRDAALTIPGDLIHKETIGSQGLRLKKRLEEFLNERQRVSVLSEGEFEWLNRFLSDEEFQTYVFRLLDFLSARARASLLDGKHLPPLEDRANAVARDNAEEFEDEIGRAEAARESAERAQKAAEEAKNTAESIIPNMLTTLGVFIAIVVAVVACYLSVLLSSHVGEAAKPLDMSMILLMGHILMNMIFLLLYLISKMSVHSLACHCMEGDQRDCSRCSPDLRRKCRVQHKVWLRYPYIVLMNGAFATAYCALGLWYLIERYLGTNIDQILKGNQIYAVIVVAATAILIVSVGVFVLLFLLRGPGYRMESEKKKAKAAEKKEQKAEAKKEEKLKKAIKRREVHKLQGEVNELNERITVLENELQVLTTKMKEYKLEEENISV